MSEQLQHLIERIQREAVEKAENEAARITADADEKAADLIRKAQEKAEAIARSAEKEAEASEARGRRALEQAARDLLIQVEQGVDGILSTVVSRAVDEALGPELVAQMLVKMAEAYAAHAGEETRLEALISPADQKKIVSVFMARYREQLTEGVDIRVDPELEKGFTVSVEGGRVKHDFSREAISEALTSFLRPKLAELLPRSGDEVDGQDRGEPR